jgi:hypothetical protein
MLAHHEHRLHNLDFWLPRFKGYNTALKKHLTTLGDVIPLEFSNCAFWLDRASLRIGNVGKPWVWQQCFWNTKAKCHNIAFQALVGMDGMAIDFWGETCGRHHDEWELARSDLNNRLAQVQLGQAIQYWAYTDKGYATQSHVKAAHHGLPAPTPAQNLANLIMGACRVAVEQFFAKWKAR